MKNKKMVKSEFLKLLTKHLLLNANFTDNNSLYGGKIGACSFLYYLSEFNDSQILYDVSNDLLLDVISSLNANDINYSTGLSGIGFALNHLAKMDFIEIPSEKNIFKEIDQKILQFSLFIDINVDSIGITTYLLDKLQFDSDKPSDDLNILLQLERIVAQVEIIGLNNQIPMFKKNDAFFQRFAQQEDLISLKGHIDTANLTTTFLKNVSNRKICQQISKDYYDVLIEKNQSILFNMTRNLHNFINLNPLLILNILTKTLNIQLMAENILPKYANIDEKNYCAIAQNIINSKIELNNYSLKFHIDNFVALINLSNSLGNQALKAIISDYLDKLLAHFMKKKFGHTYLNSKVNSLGLHGFSGLGLVVLSYLNGFDITWTKLLLNFTHEK